MTTFKDHIDAMKFRELDFRRKAEDCLNRAEAIQRESIELELFIDQEQKKEDQQNEREN